jgi:hypothetical protein
VAEELLRQVLTEDQINNLNLRFEGSGRNILTTNIGERSVAYLTYQEHVFGLAPMRIPIAKSPLLKAQQAGNLSASERLLKALFNGPEDDDSLETIIVTDIYHMSVLGEDVIGERIHEAVPASRLYVVILETLEPLLKE